MCFFVHHSVRAFRKFYTEFPDWLTDFQEFLSVSLDRRKARTAKLAVRFCPMQLRSPARLGAGTQMQVYAV
ncbi:MAG: hypothetical protein AB4040_05605 [Synechococcus sp.]